ncbi:MAG: Murein hydrolase activator NlpD [Candidatus Erwinia impunctatus]|nr:Murein hydrolase activator NlpD [Culicoides impunctatus]
MTQESPASTLQRLIYLSLLGVLLTGCAGNDNTPAPISSVGSRSDTAAPVMANSSSSRSNGLISPPPSIAVSPSQPASHSSSQEMKSNNSVNDSSRIVYNRSYENIPKGSFTGNTYTVKHGDTLFYIAWITGNDFRDLAQRNAITAPYNLNPGQQLQVSNGSGGSLTPGNAITAADASEARNPSVKTSGVIKKGLVAREPVITYSEDSGEENEGEMLPSSGTNTVATTAVPVTTPPVSSTTSSTAQVGSWRWPTDGKIIDNFSASEGGNKGVDIAGTRGQSVNATAAGRVVYAGNALRGYGNLIIIKHNDDYLSAYAHNDTMLVREQQEVKAGQKIATMGNTGTSSVRLHFEIRYKGKSVNPLRYLPQR